MKHSEMVCWRFMDIICRFIFKENHKAFNLLLFYSFQQIDPLFQLSESYSHEALSSRMASPLEIVKIPLFLSMLWAGSSCRFFNFHSKQLWAISNISGIQWNSDSTVSSAFTVCCWHNKYILHSMFFLFSYSYYIYIEIEISRDKSIM